jgi:hypothetical protein
MSESRRRGDDVRDGVSGADFVESNVSERNAVNFAFGLCEPAKDAPRQRSAPLADRRAREQSVDFCVPPLGLRAMDVHPEARPTERSRARGFDPHAHSVETQ